MSDGSDYNVIRALNAKLLLFSSGVFATKIAFEGNKMDPPNTGQWLSQKTLWARPFEVGAMSGQYRNQGTYQVSVFDPSKEGLLQATLIADGLRGWFYRGLVLTDGGIGVKVERAYRSTAIEEPNWLQVPVSIDFTAYTAY